MTAPNPFRSSCWRYATGSEDRGMPLQDLLARELSMPREEAADLVAFGSVHVGGRRASDPSLRLSASREVLVHWPWQGVRRFYELDPRRILYRDRKLLAYDKEAKIPCQAMPSDAYNNVFSALERYLRQESPRSYAALHHRLDRETTGIMVFAVHPSANKPLGEAFKSHQAIKEYLAWVEGRPGEDRWTADLDIARLKGRYAACPPGQGKEALTEFTVLRRERDRSLVLARPRTGRTHQIRLHAAACGHAVVGDRLYGKPHPRGLFLHAWSLALPSSVTGSKLVLTAPAPPHWPEMAPSELPARPLPA